MSAKELTLVREEDIVRCMKKLEKEGREEQGYQIALLMDIRNLLVRLVKDFEESLVA